MVPTTPEDDPTTGGPPPDAIERHLPTVWRVARASSPDDASAEDVVQETFLRAWRQAAIPDTPDAVRAWLLRIAINVIRDRGRRERVRRRPPPPGVGPLAPPPPDARGAADELRARAWRAMQALPDRQREVIHLAAIEGLSNSVIAAILDMTPSNVTSTLSLARRAVRERLESDAVLRDDHPSSPVRPAPTGGAS